MSKFPNQWTANFKRVSPKKMLITGNKETLDYILYDILLVSPPDKSKPKPRKKKR